MHILRRILWAFLIWFTLHSVFIICDGLWDRGNKADVAVVMGSKVNPDGSLSSRLQARVDCAYDLFKSGRVKSIFVSGGRGDEGFYEADIMKTYLLSKGVPDSSVIVDNFGFNTMATVKSCVQPAGQYNWKSIIVVSQYFHITRSKMYFRREGFNHVEGVGAKYFEFRDFYSIFREFWAFYFSFFY